MVTAVAQLVPHVTMSNNYFENLYVRGPGLLRYGYFHLKNNYANNFNQAITIGEKARIYSSKTTTLVPALKRVASWMTKEKVSLRIRAVHQRLIVRLLLNELETKLQLQLSGRKCQLRASRHQVCRSSQYNTCIRKVRAAAHPFTTQKACLVRHNA